MNVLLVSPKFMETFWSMDHILPMLGTSVVLPPLGLLTVAALLPREWDLRVADLNVRPLEDEALEWADMIFVSAMTIQSESAEETILRANAAGVPVVAGGPHFGHFDKNEFISARGKAVVDHIFKSEAEELMDEFLDDLDKGQLKPFYESESFPDLKNSPPPRFDLISHKDYYCMAVQFTRGCPFNCEFCDVVFLNGRKSRYKSVEQCLKELENIHALGWKGGIMFVDDNFIGNKKLTKELLRAIISWQKDHGRPFYFFTQASINLADDDELMRLMAEAQFMQVFLGIETPSPEALKECSKKQNQNRDLVQSVHTIQSHGMDVMSGFIVGFDSDTPEIFEIQRNFIEEAAIPVAMVGLLSAPPKTQLWHRLEKEGRLLGKPSGNNALDFNAVNFVPVMDKDILLNGYRNLLGELFNPKASYGRIRRFLKHYRIPSYVPPKKVLLREFLAFFRMLWRLGVRDNGRWSFWRLFVSALFRHPKYMHQTMNLAAMVHHCQIITEKFVARSEAAG